MFKGILKIGTHDGVFHCDEVFACFLLKLLPKFKDAEILRTRDEKLLDTCDIVVDVGGIYDFSQMRFDHHQRGFNETMASLKPGKPWKIKLSSAGLVYCHFGQEVLKQLLPNITDQKELDTIYNLMYESFVQEIDALDNGIPICCENLRYKINTNIGTRVSHLNPHWNQPPAEPNCLKQFSKAMALVGGEFTERVMYAANVWWPARNIVLKSVESRLEVHESGKIIELGHFCPWKEHYFEVTKELNIDPESINFVIFQDIKGSWRVQGVPFSASSFNGKIFLAPDWRGLRDEDVSKVAGVEGCTFVHSSGFIGGNATREGALQMAVKSIELQS